MAAPGVRAIAQTEGLELILPENSKGIGEVILAPEAPRLIDGVKIAPLKIWPDDRGYFFEIQRIGIGIASAFPPARIRTDTTLLAVCVFLPRDFACWPPACGL